jgi:hypothetical protein
MVVILLMPSLLCKSIQNKKSMNWIADINKKNTPDTLFSNAYFLFPYNINKIENITPIENVNNETL